MATSARDIALWIWENELGEPYIWGGDDPVQGWDCSGLVIEGLKSVGRLPKRGDWTAAGLRNMYEEIDDLDIRPGCLLFWEHRGKTVHVEIVWKIVNDIILTIGASGGGSRTKTEEDAVASNAYVKVRPAREGWAAVVDPFAME